MGRSVGGTVVGRAVVGRAVLGSAVVGWAVDGRAVVGRAVVGRAVVGLAVVGAGLGVCAKAKPTQASRASRRPIATALLPGWNRERSQIDHRAWPAGHERQR